MKSYPAGGNRGGRSVYIDLQRISGFNSSTPSKAINRPNRQFLPQRNWAIKTFQKDLNLLQFKSVLRKQIICFKG